ncbi:hypothetical protein BN1708_008284 [Verticillium longisporum]|uniref:PH domain-containing protein n=1 Tax=Verticillium longisporum TaxID=100787 RepID=A0A0G4N2K6_VERLO|nr:hypothetical protein BN1708_008284 [Verticillium longisporum]
MAASFADRPLLPPGDADGSNDPFVSPSAPAHHRYSNFDSQLFALGPASSPGQAKRALEAHLAETERRMEEAGKLGTALVQQRKELAQRLKEVEKLQAEGDLTDELRTKLTEIEKEYNDVARETARAFLPKQRVPSNEAAGGSPYVPEGRGGRRSVSPSKFESQAIGSPTKLSVPNRKIRNQPSNRVHDIEFAAEISTSLLAQVRNLQALLAEKDEELRDTKAEKSRLEIETEGFQQRVKTLDESEHRYKDENWNLETQIHELMASQKEGTDREKKMTQALNILQAEKNQAQKELDEVKLSHAKLAEEHEASIKHHDIELGTAKRSAALAETERTTLQRKIDDLMGQNQELAKAFSSQRGRGLERDHHMGMSDEDFETANDNVTPEHSPPPSPIKGTPRHSVLESMVDSGIMTDPVKKSREPSPDLTRTRPVMVDCGVMTEPMEPLTPRSPVSVVALDRPTSVSSMLDAGTISGQSDTTASSLPDFSRSRPQSTWSYSDAGAQHDPGMDRELSQFPLPPTMQHGFVPPSARSLSFSAIDNQDIAPVPEPVVLPPAPAALTFTALDSTAIEPKAEPEPIPEPAPALRLSPILSETVEPKVEPEVPVPVPILKYSPLMSSTVEPRAEPEVILPAPVLGLSSYWSEAVEPRSEPAIVPPPPPPAPELAFSALVSEIVEPRAEPELAPPPPPPMPQLVFSSFVSEAIEPKVEPEPPVPVAPVLSMSPLSIHDIEPLAEPEIEPILPLLALSGIVSEYVEPQPEPEEPAVVFPAMSLSALHSEHIEPRAEPEPVQVPLRLSGIESWEVVPRLGSRPVPPSLTLSSVVSEEVEPITPSHPDTLSPHFAFSSIDSVERRPLTPRTPKRDGFILPRGMESPFVNADQLRTPDDALFGGIAGRGQSVSDAGPVIAEDETCQSPSETRHPHTPESQKPFKEISSNVESRPARKPAVSMSDQSAQTSLTADAIDDMFNARSKSHNKSLSMGSSFGTPGTVRIRRYSQDQASLSSVRRMSVESQHDTTAAPQRPGSASSRRNSNVQPMPPLPQNHMEVIEAARSGSAHGTPGTASVMGPPLWPASAMRGQRPQTPSSVRPQSPVSVKGTPTPKANRTGAAAHGTAIIHSPTKASARSRRSSVSSFASEIDTRFNIRANGLGVDATGFGPNTDPRMIQAITQTMIGEYLWKYTRKAGRGQMSENRHRRYFWVHPYTRTLYWSDRDPSTAGRADMKAKSVSIEAVRVVTDDNPMPPGLHRKSLIVVSPGRQIKFTSTTGSRHETWFNALSYLLLRTNDEGQTDAEEMAGHITQADVDEFNPQVGGMRPTASAAPSTRPRMAPSLSSYNSRTTRNQSPAIDMSMEVPRLTPTHQKNVTPQRPSIGTLGRLSGYWKNSQVISGTFSSLRSRTTSGQHGNSIYEASEVHDSAEVVREMIERQDREADRLENVRACCDGRHDVGTLHHHSTLKRSRGSHAHSHTGPVETNLAQEGDVDTVNRLEESGDVDTADLKPVEKSHSAPLSDNVPPTGLLGRKLAGKTLRPSTAGVSTGIEPNSPTSSRPKTLRSNSMSSPSDPIVGTDTAHADVFKPSSPPSDNASAMMAALSARSVGSTGQTPTASPARPASLAKDTDPSPPSSREDTDNEKETEKTPVAAGRRSTASSLESAPADDPNSSAASFASSLKGSVKSNAGSLRSNPGSLTGLFRRDTALDTANSSSQGEEQNQKRVTLAAVANAATQARQWGWNAIQRHKDARNGISGETEPPLDLNKPMGRGRPLPPPGTPLPPPDRTQKVTPIPVPSKRKPEPAPSLPDRPHSDDSINSAGERKPPVPSRRHREIREETDTNDLFVVAAPMESEPSTPLNEDMTDYTSRAPAWEAGVQETGSSLGKPRMAPDEEDHATPMVKQRSTVGLKSSASRKADSPIEARPAQVLLDDDDDFSGWLDNTEEEGGEPEAPLAEAKRDLAAVPAEMRS